MKPSGSRSGTFAGPIAIAWAAVADTAIRPAATRTVRNSREVVRMGVPSFLVDVRREVMGSNLGTRRAARDPPGYARNV